MAFSNFIPELWGARLQANLDKNLVYAQLLNRNYEGEIKQMGDKVHINQLKNLSIGTYTGSIPTFETLDSNTSTLEIDQAKYFAFQIDDVDNAQSNPKLMEKAMQRAAYGLADTADAYIAGILATGATNSGKYDLGGTTPIVPTASTAYDLLVDLASDLTEKSVPTIGRWVVIPAFFHGLLLKDARFVSGSEGADVTRANGIVGRAAGFDVFVSPNVPETSDVMSIVAGTDEAATYADQINTVEACRAENAFADKVKGLHLYGACVADDKGISVLKVKRQ